MGIESISLRRSIGYPGMLVLLCSWLLAVSFVKEGTSLASGVSAAYFLILGTGLFVATSRSQFRSWAVAGAVAFAVVNLILSFYGRGAGSIVAMLNMLYVGAVPVIVLRDVLTAPRVTGSTIVGAVNAYLLMGIGWGLLFTVIETLAPGSFRFAGDATGKITDLYYFSFTTLTTLGYGDMTPVSVPARSMAIAEALAGQLYLVVLVARLVSVHASGESSE